MACEEVICKTVEIKTDKTTKGLKEVETSMDKVGGKTAGLSKGLGELPGPLGKAKQGVGALSKAFKALLANPIVLLIAGIVAGLAALFKAFTKTQAGADKMKEATAALSAVLEVITERAARLFKALGQIFRGNFKEGFEEMKGAVSGVKDELTEAAQAAIEFERAQRRLYESETDVITANAERRQQIAELVFLTRDFTKSIDERRQAVIEADAIEKQILQDNIALQEQRVELARQEIENTPELQRTREQTRKLAEEEAKLIDLQTESLGRQRELKNRLNDLDNQAAAKRKADADAEKKRIEEQNKLREEEAVKEKERQDKLAQEEKERQDALAAEEKARFDSLEDYKKEKRAETFEGRMENLRLELEAGAILQEEFDLRALDLEREHQEELKALEEDRIAAGLEAERKAADEKAKLAAQELAQRRAVQGAIEGIYGDSLNALMGFLGEGSKAAKAIAIADATKSAIQGAIGAYTSTVSIPVVGPVLAPIAAAASLAAGMANVRKIAQTPDPVGGGGGSVPSVSLAAPEATGAPIDPEQAALTIPQDVSIVQDQTAGSRAVKTYVVQSDVTAEQDIEAKRKADVTL